MAYKNKLVRNPKTGQTIRFIQTSKETKGDLLEMESTYESNSKEPPPHYHPEQDETFLVLEGEMTVRVNGELKVLGAGDQLVVEKNVIHSMWNNTNSKTVVNWRVTPALDTEYFFENLMGLAAEGKTNSSGMPGLLQIALFSQRFSNTFRLAKPPHLVLKMLFLLLTPFAYLKGLRPAYQQYQD